MADHARPTHAARSPLGHEITNSSDISIQSERTAARERDDGRECPQPQLPNENMERAQQRNEQNREYEAENMDGSQGPAQSSGTAENVTQTMSSQSTELSAAPGAAGSPLPAASQAQLPAGQRASSRQPSVGMRANSEAADGTLHIVCCLHQNRGYIEPGYDDLNPANLKGPNRRPIFGLAGVLPRTLRGAMLLSAQAEEAREDSEVALERNSGKQTGLDTVRMRTESGASHSIHNEREDGPTITTKPFERPPGAKQRHTTELSGRSDREHKREDGMGAENTEVEKEVHNSHTWWSSIRLQCREPFAEFLAVCPLCATTSASYCLEIKANEHGRSAA